MHLFARCGLKPLLIDDCRVLCYVIQSNNLRLSSSNWLYSAGVVCKDAPISLAESKKVRYAPNKWEPQFWDSKGLMELPLFVFVNAQTVCEVVDWASVTRQYFRMISCVMNWWSSICTPSKKTVTLSWVGYLTLQINSWYPLIMQLATKLICYHSGAMVSLSSLPSPI